jgi:hypothetical protein
MSDINQLTAITHKRARGFVLKCLNYYPSDDINTLIVADFVRNCGCACTDSEVESYIDYLQSKGYVKKEEINDKRIADFSAKVARITPKGIDLLEANIPEDPGIVL